MSLSSVRSFAFVLLAASAASSAAVDPWADVVHAYNPGNLTALVGGFYNDPSLALGAVSVDAARLSQSTDVVQLGDGGSVTLFFDEPILNNIPYAGSTNPLGYDFTVFGNAFEAGEIGTGIFFREPGFVEVAEALPNGQPGTFYLIRPDKLPANLTAADRGPGTALNAFYADVHWVDGTGNPLLPPGAAGSAGGDGFLLERGVAQTSPGVPLLVGGQFVPVSLASIQFLRITDAILGDRVPGLGFLSTDIDAAIDLPGTTAQAVPEPMSLGVFWVAAVLRRRRRV